MFDLAGAKLRLLYEILLFVRNECQLILQFKYAFLVAVVFCLQLTGFNYQRWNIIAIETKQKAFQQLLVDSYTNWAVRLLHFSPFKCKLKKFHLQKLNGVVWDSNRGPLVSEATMKPVDKHRTKSLVLLLPFIGILPTPKASQPKWSEVARIIFSVSRWFYICLCSMLSPVPRQTPTTTTTTTMERQCGEAKSQQGVSIKIALFLCLWHLGLDMLGASDVPKPKRKKLGDPSEVSP